MNDIKKLSQIIMYVDKRICNEDICIFSTNVLTKKEDIRFTYLDYYDDFIINSYKQSDEILFITDSFEMAEKVHGLGIAVAALINDFNNKKGYPSVPYCIEDIKNISYEDVERIWKRYRQIPWLITKTDRLTIREQTLDDIEDIYNMYADETTTAYMDKLYDDIEEEKEYMRDYIAHQYPFYEYGIWTLIDKCTGEYVGRAGLSIREGYEDVELGYAITKAYRNKGYAKEAIKAIIKYAKDELYITRLIAFVRPQNLISIKILEDMGFIKVNTLLFDGITHIMYSFDL